MKTTRTTEPSNNAQSATETANKQHPKDIEPQKPANDVLEFIGKLAHQDDNELTFSPKLTRIEVRAKLLQILREQGINRPTKCIYCGHEHVHSKGLLKDGRRRWLCCKCHRSFNDFSGTVFSYINKINEMVKYLETDFFLGTALLTAADTLDVDARTVFAWRHKLGTALRKQLGDLPDKFVSVVEFFEEISLKGAHHAPGRVYKNPKVNIEKLYGQRYVNGFVSTDDTEHYSIRLMSYGATINNNIGERFLKKCVRANKRIVVSPMGSLAKVGEGLKRGKRRIERCRKEGGALCEKWKDLANSRTFFQITQIWGIKFHGVATKYLNNYYATISWITTHFREPNWLKKFLQELLSNRDAVREYNYLRFLKLE